MRTLLLFAPSVAFGLIALASAAFTLDAGGRDTVVQPSARNRLATWVAVGAAVLCALSLLAGTALLAAESLPLGD